MGWICLGFALCPVCSALAGEEVYERFYTESKSGNATVSRKVWGDNCKVIRHERIGFITYYDHPPTKEENEVRAKIVFTKEEFVEEMKKRKLPKVMVWIDGINITERERLRESYEKRNITLREILKKARTFREVVS